MIRFSLYFACCLLLATAAAEQIAFENSAAVMAQVNSNYANPPAEDEAQRLATQKMFEQALQRQAMLNKENREWVEHVQREEAEQQFIRTLVEQQKQLAQQQIADTAVNGAPEPAYLTDQQKELKRQATVLGVEPTTVFPQTTPQFQQAIVASDQQFRQQQLYPQQVPPRPLYPQQPSMYQPMYPPQPMYSPQPIYQPMYQPQMFPQEQGFFSNTMEDMNSDNGVIASTKRTVFNAANSAIDMTKSGANGLRATLVTDEGEAGYGWIVAIVVAVAVMIGAVVYGVVIVLKNRKTRRTKEESIARGDYQAPSFD